MKKRFLILWALLAISLLFNFTACPGGGTEEDEEGYFTGSTLSLIVGQSKPLKVTSFNTDGKTVTWKSDAAGVATVASTGNGTAIVIAVGVSTGGSALATSTTEATGTAKITATAGNDKKEFTINTTIKATEDIMSLDPLKDTFSKHFPMTGNIFNPGDVSGGNVTATRLTRHFNVLTAENNMKPYSIATGRNTSSGDITYSWTTADNMVNAARASGFEVVGHTLLWHSQNADWVWNQIATKTGTMVSGMTKEKALEIMKGYITEVAGHFKDKIYSWDVLNEVFPDNVSETADWKDAMRKAASGEGQDANPWYIAIGSDFVYEGFLAARKADPIAILYYNDYSLDSPKKAKKVYDMVKAVNEKYASGNDRPAGEDSSRLLIEGIGMQSHHNTNVTAAQIKATLNLFKPLGVKISISELDVLGQTYQQFSPSPGSGVNKHTQSTVTNAGLVSQARLYSEYMKVFIEYKDIIERISFWGVTDDKSWRSAGLPLLFDKDGKAKPSYYAVVREFN